LPVNPCRNDYFLKKNPENTTSPRRPGSATHLSMAYFSSLAGVEMVHIPFKATNEAIQEVMVGRAHAVMASTIGALPFARIRASRCSA